MRLSTRGQYGVRALAQLAANHDKGPTPLREISYRENISYQYLEQIFLDLKKDELVVSVRGARGGYTLARHPEEITVGDIIRTLEGPIGPVDCVKEEDGKNCERSSVCVSRNVWEKLRDRMTEVLDDFTLKDLIVKSG